MRAYKKMRKQEAVIHLCCVANIIIIIVKCQFRKIAAHIKISDNDQLK